jgi:hypothetical protein
VKRRMDESRRGTLILVGLLCWATSAAGVAHGQRAVLGPAAADSRDVADSAATALADALRMQGMQVVGFEDAKKQLGRGENCADNCATRLLHAVKADFSASVEIRSDGSAGTGRAAVTLTDSSEHHFAGDASVRDGDVRDATTRALLEARAYQLLGPGPWLEVQGTPEGADVLIDGSRVGKVPYRAGIAAGTHQLVVRDAGYARFAQTLEVPGDESKKLALKVALEPTLIDAPAAAMSPLDAPQPTAAPARGKGWLVLPIVVGALGVGLATAVTIRLGTGLHPCIGRDDQGLCTEKRSLNVWPTAAGYALGAVLIGTGIVWIALEGRDQSPRVAADIGLDHIALTGSF